MHLGRSTIVLLATISAQWASGASLLTWDFLAAGGNAATNGNVNTVASTSSDAGMQASAVTTGAGAGTAALQTFGDRGAMNSQGQLNAASLAAAVSGNRYYEVVTAPASGYAMSLSGATFVLFQQNAHAEATADLQYSLDGFATAGVDVGSVSPINDGWTGSAKSWDLSGVGALQDVSSSVTFRLYCYGFGGYEDQGLGQIPGNNTDVEFTGTVSPVPEPTAIASLGLCALACLRRRRD